jgi:hypothetical protein
MALSEADKTQLRLLTQQLVNGPGTEGEKQKVADAITRLSPDPGFLEYIFWPKQDEDLDDLIETAIAMAERYRPIIL